MTLFSNIAAIGVDAALDVLGEAATYTPLAGTGPVAIRAAFGPERQDEMSIGDGQLRKSLRQIVISCTGATGIADPRRDDTISRGDSLNLETYQIVDFVERNDNAAICLCRRMYRNEVTRTGPRAAM